MVSDRCPAGLDQPVDADRDGSAGRAVGWPQQDQERVVAGDAVLHPAQQADLVLGCAEHASVLGQVDQDRQRRRVRWRPGPGRR